MKKILKASMVGLLLASSVSTVADAATYHYTNQNTTAYLANSGARTFHGTIPTAYITAAVHPKTFNVPTSGTIFPFGSYIVADSPVQLAPGMTATYFKVEDMGEVYNENNRSLYWFDIYFGLRSIPQNVTNANNYGQSNLVSYSITY
ncbi:hypothetical protein [Paenibacillus odorifer]|uniref:hypothetical protein n=1 Tax=Paenibacillus odorifer TaxID=189426 RepID=UPI00096E61B9|nr:hypothetical protein [Paenibacillus odorifer]OMD08205.1 hypothetical protein BJP47_30085 [Paenibacillus odorifer]